MMNTLDVLGKAYSDPMLAQIFLGVYPADKLPNIKFSPAALIANLDTSKSQGSHWVALYFKKDGTCEYFDSYGRKPTCHILKFIADNCSMYTYNNLCIQDFWSVSCGQMCLYFLIWRSRGLKMKEIIKSITNDDFIAGFIDSL